MKKLLLTLITFIYLLMSSGIAMDVHYCMGNRSGIDFYSSGDAKCGKCGMTEKKGGCCHDEHKFVKLDNDHKNATALPSIKIPAFENTEITSYKAFIPHTFLTTAPAHAPPDIARPDLCVLNCVFRI